MKKHVKAVHENQPLTCILCSNTFKNKRNLNVHMKSIHLKEKYPCSQCTRIHEGKIRKCELCGQEFKGRQHLSYHKRYRHEGILCDCDLCIHQSTTKSSLLKHKQLIHHIGQNKTE